MLCAAAITAVCVPLPAACKARPVQLPLPLLLPPVLRCRIGRTGRAGKKGLATAFFSEKDTGELPAGSPPCTCCLLFSLQRRSCFTFQDALDILDVQFRPPHGLPGC